MTATHPDLPAVVILKMVPDVYAHGRLAAARTLGSMGVPTVMVTERRWDPAGLSRWVTDRRVIRFPEAPDHADRDSLLALAGEVGGRPVLLPTDDVAALFVQDHAGPLGEVYRFPVLPEGLARSLADKGTLMELCRRAGVPVPEACFPKDRLDAERFAGRIDYPVVVKSMDPLLMRARPGARSVTLAGDARALLAAYDAMEVPGEPPNLMFQEYIPGGPPTVWMFNGYFDSSSRCVLGSTGQKLRQFEPSTGSTSLGISRGNAEVTRLACTLLGAVGYRGIVDMGLRLDERDGRFKVLDVNPRMGATFRLFSGRAGGDVVRAMYLDLTGRSVPADPGVEGRRWAAEPLDYWAYSLERRAGRLTTGEWLRSLRGVDEFAWWDPHDPLPAAGMAMAMGLRATRSRLGPRSRRRAAVAGG